MTQVKAEQINRLFTGLIRINGLSVTGSSTNVTSVISTALSTAGDGGVSVPVQVASTGTMGVITSTGNNRCPLVNATTEEPILTNTNNKVYGKLSESSGVYTLTYFSLENGVETAYSFGSATNIDFFISYRFDFYRVPADFATRYATTEIEDIFAATATSQKTFTEQLTVTGANTLSNISKTPISTTAIRLFVQRVAYFATNDFTVNTSTKALTWNASNAKYNLAVGDLVFAEYETNE